MNTFFTADTHFSHKNIIKYCDRPFTSVEDMDKTIIDNWNKKVGPRDLVYHLGDFGMGRTQDLKNIKNKLNGRIEFVFGNHDRSSFDIFKPIRYMLDIRVGNQPITLCHYAMRVWNKSHYNAWHLYGHSHGLEGFGKSFDIGMDVRNFTPISFDEVKKEMDTRPDNFDLIKDSR